MAKLDAIQQKVSDLRNVLNDTVAMRETWQTTTEPLLVEKLKAITLQIPFEWTVQRNEARRNLETVELVLNTSPSGIVEGGVAATKSFAKMGAKLIFAQNYHGHVCVLTQMPFLEGLMQPQPPALHEIVRPEAVNEALILKQVENFLTMLIDWEDGELKDQRAIGFVNRTPKT